MTKNSSGRVAVGIIAAVLLSGCAAAPPLATELTSALRASTGTLVLGDLDSVDGTDVLVVCPYETEASITARLGFEWADAPDLSSRDDRQAIAIIRNGAVVSSAELARSDADFCSDGGWRVVPTSTELRVDTSGDPVRVFAPE